MARVAILQIDVSDTESQLDREARVLELVLAQKGKCELAVLPELWNIGAFNYRDLESSAQPLDGDLVTVLKAVAKTASIWLHGGSFVERLPDGGMANTAVLIDPSGNLVAHYRKIHLYGFDKGEAVTMTRGTEVIQVEDTPVGSTGLAICYDLRFPELFRKQSDAGIETILITSGWPTPRISHWRILLQARAIENQCWVIACNEVGPNGNVMLGGHSMVVSPRGEIVAEAGTAEEVLYADVDLAEVEKFRLEHPFQRDRFIR